MNDLDKALELADSSTRKMSFAMCSNTGTSGIAVFHDEDINFPAKGDMIYKGKIMDIHVWNFTPNEKGIWIDLVHGVVKPELGTTVLCTAVINGDDEVTVVTVENKAIYKTKKYGDASGKSTLVNIFLVGRYIQPSEIDETEYGKTIATLVDIGILRPDTTEHQY